jgi:acetate---CoA ligase (ADP-forming)
VRTASYTGAAADVDLDRLFRPGCIAVIGASDTTGSANALLWGRIQSWAHRGGAKAVPINPNHGQVSGTRAYRSVLEVPGDIDVAAILVRDVESALRTAVEKKIPYVIVFEAGFAELGAEGAARQAKLLEIIGDSGVRMLGPNTNMNIFEDFLELPGKAIALITQSGHQGRPIFQGQELGIRLSHWAPTGNEADLDAADFVRYFSNKPDTGVIAAYLEGFRSGSSFRSAVAHAAQRGVPVVIVKVGRTSVGQSWTQSHTGHLAGADDVMSAVLRQYGVVRVDGLDELLDTAAMFARSRRPTARGVCVYSISGGTSAHMADMLTVAGLEMPALSADTQAALRQWIPGYLRISNPVDSGGPPSGDWRGVRILETILADPSIGVVVVPVTGAVPPTSDKLVADLIDVASRTDKTICVIWGSPSGVEDAYRKELLSSPLPVFRTFRNCVTAVRALIDFYDFQDRIDSMVVPDRETQSVATPPGEALNELEAKSILKQYSIPVTRDILCVDVESALAAAGHIGERVVLKAAAAGVAHKSEFGLVRIGVTDANEIVASVTDFERIVTAHGFDYQGTLVCEDIAGGVETIVGISEDLVFGPVVMFGMGGVAAELFQDVTFRVPPFSRSEAHRMIREVRGFALLQGYRGTPPANVDALVDVIMRVQRIAQDGILTELDINPLKVLPDRVVALDAFARKRAVADRTAGMQEM